MRGLSFGLAYTGGMAEGDSTGESIAKPWLFKPGCKPGPGRPKTAESLTDCLKRKFIDCPADRDAVVDALIALAKGSDVQAIKLAFDRHDGLQKQIVENTNIQVDGKDIDQMSLEEIEAEIEARKEK